MNVTEKQPEKPSIVAILEDTDKQLNFLSELTYGLITKGHQLRDTNTTQCGEVSPEREKPYTLEEILSIQTDKLSNLNQELKQLLDKLNGLF